MDGRLLAAGEHGHVRVVVCGKRKRVAAGDTHRRVVAVGEYGQAGGGRWLVWEVVA